MKSIKRTLALVMAAAMLLGMLVIPASAAVSTPVTISLSYYANATGTTPLTAVESGKNFFVFVDMEGNPVDPEETICGFGMILCYDGDKVTPNKTANAKLVSLSTFTSPATGVNICTWAGTDGITVEDEETGDVNIVESGTLFAVRFTAKQDLSLEDVQAMFSLAESNAATTAQVKNLNGEDIPVIGFSASVAQVTLDESSFTVDGEELTASATAQSGAGNDVSASVTWSVAPADKGVAIAADGTVTVDGKAEAGTYTVTATGIPANFVSGSASATLTVARAASRAASIVVEGPESVDVPYDAAEADNTAAFTATVTDQFDDEVALDVVWTVSEAAGVSVADGVVTVGKTAAAGEVTVTASRDGVNGTATLTIVKNVVESIEVDASGVTTAYQVDDALNLNGVKVTATYADGTTAVVTGKTTFVPADLMTLTADDTTVTATYTDDYKVTVTDSFAITVAKKTLTAADFVLSDNEVAYTGAAHDVTVTYKDGITEEYAGAITVNQVSETDADEYAITVTTAGGTKYEAVTQALEIGTLTISPAALTVEGEAVATAAYGTKLAEIEITGLTVTLNGNTVAGTWAFSGEDVLDVGNTQSFEATFTPASGADNYQALTKAIVPVITPMDVTADEGETAINVVKGVGTFSDPTFAYPGTLAYSYEGKTEKTAIVTALAELDVGATGSISYTFTASGNYTGAITGTLSFTIVDVEFSGAEEAVTTADAVYGDTWGDIVSIDASKLTASVAETECTDAVYTVQNADEIPAAGTQTYTVLFSGTINGKAYTDITVTTGTVEVAQRELTITGVAATDREYDATTAVALTGGELQNVVEGDEVGFALGEGSVETADAAEGKAVTTAITLTGTDAANYTLTQPEVTVTIAPKAVAVIWGETSFTYNGSVQAPTASAESGIPGTALTVEVSGGASDKGTYTATADLGNANFAIQGETGSQSFTIAPLTAVLSWSETSLTYTGAEQSVSASVSNAVTGDAVEVTVTGASATDAGSYTATATGLSNANYALPADAEQAWSIAKADYAEPPAFTVTVPMNGTEKTVDLATLITDETVKELVISGIAEPPAPNPEGFASAVKSGDTTVTVTTAAVSEENTTAVYLVTVESKNYNDFAVTLQIVSKMVTFDFAEYITVNEDLVYGVTNGETLTIKDGPVEGKDGNDDAVAGTLTINDADVIPAAGTATVTATFTVVGGDYDGTQLTESYEVSIGKRTVTIEGVTAAEREYDATTAVTLSGGELQNVVEGDELGFTLGDASVETADAAEGKAVTTAIVLTGDKAVNYELTQPTVTVTIAPKAVAVVWDNYDLTYTGSVLAPTASAETGIEGETLTVTVSGGASNAGTHTAAADLGNANYTAKDDTGSFSFTIAPLTAVITWSSETLTYNGTEQSVSATVSNAVTGDTVDVTVSGASATDAGDYQATATALSNANYALAADEAPYDWSIGKAARDLSVDATSLLLYPDANEGTVTASVVNDLDESAVITFTLDDPSLVLVKQGENAMTYTGFAAGTATLTVSVAETDNYLAAADQTVTITVLTEYLTGVTAAGADSEDQVKAALEGDTVKVTGLVASADGVLLTPETVAPFTAAVTADGITVSLGEDVLKTYAIDKTGLVEKAGNVTIEEAQAAGSDGKVEEIVASAAQQLNALAEAYPATSDMEVKVEAAVAPAYDAAADALTVAVTLNYTVSEKAAGETAFTEKETGSLTNTEEPVKVSANLPAEVTTAPDTAKIALDAEGKEFAYAPVTVEAGVATWYQDAFFAPAQLISSAKITVSFQDEAGAELTQQVYTLADVGAAFLAQEKAGNVFNGWIFTADGTAVDGAFKTLTEDLFNQLVGAAVITASPKFTVPYVAPVIVYYSVSVEKAENGTVSVSTSSASEGTLVTITVKPNAGFKLDAVRAENATVVKQDENTFTFRMPNDDVTVKATFKLAAGYFEDVEPNYAYDAIYWAAENGITVGKDATHFGPTDTANRACFVTFLYRLAGQPIVSGEEPFEDVSADDFYYNAVLWAVQNGITRGTDETHFTPKAPITRAQVVTMLYRYAKAAVEPGEVPFTDVKAGPYYDAILWAYQNDVVKGVGNNLFAPDTLITRQDLVTILYRYVTE